MNWDNPAHTRYLILEDFIQIFRNNTPAMDVMKIKTMADLSLVKDGPIQVKGGFELKGPDGNPIDCKEQIFLCRCGATGNKPFCDGSHTKSGFSD